MSSKGLLNDDADADDVIDNIDDGADDKGDKAGRCPKLCWSL